MARGDMTEPDEVRRAEAAKLKALYRMMGAEERARPTDASRGRFGVSWPSFTLPSFTLPTIKLPSLALPRLVPPRVSARPTFDLSAGASPVPRAALLKPRLEPAPPAPPPRARRPEPHLPRRAPSAGIRLPRLSLPRVAIPRLSFPRIAFPRIAFPRLALPRGPAVAIVAACCLVLALGVVALRFRPSPVVPEAGRDRGTMTASRPVADVAARSAEPAPPIEPEVAAIPTEPVAPVTNSTRTASLPSGRRQPKAALTGAATAPLAKARTVAADVPSAVRRIDPPAEPPRAALAAKNDATPAASARAARPVAVDVARPGAADTNPLYTESKNVVQVDQKQARKAARDSASDAIRTLRLR